MRRLVEPFYLARRALRAAVARFGPELEGIVVDIGCGTQPYRDCLPACTYVGLEIFRDSPAAGINQVDVFYDGRSLPIATSAANAVLCTQVLEHVFQPQPFLVEIARILRPGGKLLLTVPFVWDEHEQPWDFARYSSFGLAHLLAEAGFRIVNHEKTLADASVLVQLWLAYLFKITRHWPKNLRRLTFLTMALPANVFGLVLQKVAPSNPDLYLDNVVLCERTDP